MEIINIEKSVFEAIMSRFENFAVRLENLFDKQCDKSLNTWLDNQDVCQILNISPRTLQTYRDTGRLAFTQVNHKIYYKLQDVQKLIK